jgi:predicted alpha/beta-fold hydrolase
MIKHSFIPHRLLFNGQLQTIIAHSFASPPVVGRYEVDTITLHDGDKINLHIDRPENDRKHVVVLLHGLGGSSESDYMLRISAKLNSIDYPVIRFNHRGCGAGGSSIARSIYHAGRGQDIDSALLHIHKTWPDYKVSIAAFSLSANMLLKYLADYADSSSARGLYRALAVCPPVDLEMCSLAISSRKNIHLDMYYTRKLIKAAHEKKELFPDTPTVLFPRGTNLRSFDEIYTAKIGGFRSRDDYYSQSSAKDVVTKIRNDTGIILAEDDPIIPKQSFANVKYSSNTRVYSSPYGGHMGFVNEKPTVWGDRWWMDEAVINFFIDPKC